MGIEMIKDLQECDPVVLEEKFGKYGFALWEIAHGIDSSQVIPYTGRKSISSENTFDENVSDKEYLEAFIISLVEQLTFTLRKENFLTSCAAIKLRYPDFETRMQQTTLPLTSSDHIIIPKVKELFHKIYKSETPVRLIGVRLSNLIHGSKQIDMFNDTEEIINLYKALDKINKKFGSKTVHRAKTIAMSNRSFNPFNGKKLD
jgi:DNA polymerase-4